MYGNIMKGETIETNPMEHLQDSLSPAMYASVLRHFSPSESSLPTDTIPSSVVTEGLVDIAVTESTITAPASDFSLMEGLSPEMQASVARHFSNPTKDTLVQQISVDQGTDKVEHSNALRDSSVNVAKRLGYAVLGMAIGVGSLTGAASVMDRENQTITAEALAQPNTELTVVAEVTSPTTEVTNLSEETSPVISEPATPTVEAQPQPTPFEVQLGDFVGTLRVPALCIEIDVNSFSEDEDITGLTGNGGGTLDQLEPTGNDQIDCENTDMREENLESSWGRDYISRNEREREQYRGGNLSQWDPRAGYVMSATGEYLSSLPGYGGNFVVAGHGSTYSAAFADFLLLEPGDNAEFTRSDGEIINYVMLEKVVVDDQDYDNIFDYRNLDYASTMTTFYCTGVESGEPGTGASMRVLIRWGVQTL